MLKSNDLAIRAFIEPVRSVLFVDDQFPTYEELVDAGAAVAAPQPPVAAPAGAQPPAAAPGAAQPPAPAAALATAMAPAITVPGRAETARARRLVASCRQSNFVCDVRNNPDALAAVDVNRLGVSDLVVVDYHLRGAGNPDDAVNFLARLARSPHFNLAVIYTAEKNLIAVRQTVAARIRGISLELGFAGDLPEVTPDQNALRIYLDDYLNAKPSVNGQPFQAIFNQDAALLGGLTKEARTALLQRHFDAFIEHTFGTNADIVEEVYIPVSMSGSGENGHWVQGGNVFVVIVPKTEDAATENIGVLLNKLTAAIVDWSPSLIDVMLAAAAGSIQRHGLRKTAVDFGDDVLCNGLVYWFLAGDSAYGEAAQIQSEADRRDRIEQLHRTVFELLCAAALKSAADLSEAVVAAALPQGQNPIHIPAADRAALAKSWAKAKNTDEWKMMLAANAFLCSTAFAGKHVTTGTIFRKEGTEEYWLCVSAGCDMVPRSGPASNEWRNRLYPFRLIHSARLPKHAAPPTALIGAHHGRTIFIRQGRDIVALEFVPKGLTEPNIAPLFAENAAMVANGIFRGFFVQKAADGTLATVASNYTPVGQLRPEYAARLLQQTGHHLSRIGVDFLSRPDAPAAN